MRNVTTPKRLTAHYADHTDRQPEEAHETPERRERGTFLSSKIFASFCVLSRQAFCLFALATWFFVICRGAQAVFPPPDGGYAGGNTAAGQNALLSLGNGTYNTAVGLFSLMSLDTGNFNTALGAGTLLANTGDYNTATGTGALLSNTTGLDNTANGAFALFTNTTGTNNTATGHEALFSNSVGNENTANGYKALYFNTTGTNNTATGSQALRNNTIGFENVAIGDRALENNTEGVNNTASGFQALQSNTLGSLNTATGGAALSNNTAGNFNTANGYQALFSNTSGSENTAIGNAALQSNTTSDFNTAIGSGALLSNTTGSANTAAGHQPLIYNTTGVGNTATGFAALAHNTTGDFNTANGLDALRYNTTGFQNTAIGSQALLNNSEAFKNTGVGYQALLNNTGSGNTALGYLAGSNLTTGDDNICIGADGVAGEGGTIRIGRSFIGAAYIAGISGQTASGGAQVFVDADGKLGTNTSSERFKENIKPMGKDSEAILALTPVSFRYREEIDPQSIPQFGLIAEEVEKVNPELIIRDKEGKPQTVRYEQINAMLLNEFLKEHTTVLELQKEIVALTARLKEQDSKIQKVSAQLEVNKAVPQVVQNP
jgi:hypothetical protein